MAPWTTSSQPNGEFLIKWVSRNNKDVIFGGVDSVGKGYYKNGHDDLQVSSFLGNTSSRINCTRSRKCITSGSETP